MRFKTGDKVRVHHEPVLTGANGQIGTVLPKEPKDRDMPGFVPVKLDNGEWYFTPAALERIQG
jgi:hypothetical protein